MFIQTHVRKPHLYRKCALLFRSLSSNCCLNVPLPLFVLVSSYTWRRAPLKDSRPPSFYLIPGQQLRYLLRSFDSFFNVVRNFNFAKKRKQKIHSNCNCYLDTNICWLSEYAFPLKKGVQFCFYLICLFVQNFPRLCKRVQCFSSFPFLPI